MKLAVGAAVKTGLMLICYNAFAAEVPDYGKLIKSTQTVGPLGKALAGDSTNFYTGETSFSNTDLSIPGNNALSVAIGRSYKVEFKHMVAQDNLGDQVKQYSFGDWDLDVPHLVGTFTQQYGWQVDSTTPLNRCSVLGQVKADGTPSTGVPLRQTAPNPGVRGFWTGYTLHVGGDSQSMLIANNPLTRPTTGGPYHWTTNKDWWLSCKAGPIANDAGEGFIAVAPDGTKYTFDRISRRNVEVLIREIQVGGQKVNEGEGYRAEVLLLATRVEDRFGNWVTYSYTTDTFAKLQSIDSSDGRHITVTYNPQGFIDAVTDGTRTVHYAYSGNRLTTVTLPDDATWQYGFETLDAMVDQPGGSECPQGPYGGYNCLGVPGTYGAGNGYVVHPSGARVDFYFETHYQTLLATPFSTYPLGLIQKEVSGPGLATQRWYYGFAPTLEQTKAQCYAGACPTRVWSDEVGPDYRITRRLFGLTENIDEGLLLQELDGVLPVSSPVITQSPNNVIAHSLRGSDIDIADDPTTVSLTGAPVTITGNPVFYRETDSFYQTGTLLGRNPMRDKNVDTSQVFWSEHRLPIVTRKTVVQGRTFSYQVNAWDTFDRPTSTTRSSTTAP